MDGKIVECRDKMVQLWMDELLYREIYMYKGIFIKRKGKEKTSV